MQQLKYYNRQPSTNETSNIRIKKRKKQSFARVKHYIYKNNINTNRYK